MTGCDEAQRPQGVALVSVEVHAATTYRAVGIDGIPPPQPLVTTTLHIVVA
jgi:hypothetical protein